MEFRGLWVYFSDNCCRIPLIGLLSLPPAVVVCAPPPWKISKKNVLTKCKTASEPYKTLVLPFGDENLNGSSTKGILDPGSRIVGNMVIGDNEYHQYTVCRLDPFGENIGFVIYYILYVEVECPRGETLDHLNWSQRNCVVHVIYYIIFGEHDGTKLYFCTTWESE